MQYFYIVVYTIVGDDLTMCKIGLNPHQLTKWGRREATKHPERSYKLYRQSITHTGKITFYKQLKSYATEVEHSLKVAKDGTKIILFALDTEDTSVTGLVIGQLWMVNSCTSAIIKNLMALRVIWTIL